MFSGPLICTHFFFIRSRRMDSLSARKPMRVSFCIFKIIVCSQSSLQWGLPLRSVFLGISQPWPCTHSRKPILSFQARSLRRSGRGRRFPRRFWQHRIWHCQGLFCPGAERLHGLQPLFAGASPISCCAASSACLTLLSTSNKFCHHPFHNDLRKEEMYAKWLTIALFAKCLWKK